MYCEFQAEELVKRLCDLEHSASSDAAVREKIAALPPEVSDIQHLSKISGKIIHLNLIKRLYSFSLFTEYSTKSMCLCIQYLSVC